MKTGQCTVPTDYNVQAASRVTDDALPAWETLTACPAEERRCPEVPYQHTHRPG